VLADGTPAPMPSTHYLHLEAGLAVCAFAERLSNRGTVCRALRDEIAESDQAQASTDRGMAEMVAVIEETKSKSGDA
jgi:hypothetical protein